MFSATHPLSLTCKHNTHVYLIIIMSNAQKIYQMKESLSKLKRRLVTSEQQLYFFISSIRM